MKKSRLGNKGLLAVLGLSGSDAHRVESESRVLEFLIDVKTRMELTGTTNATLARKMGVQRSQITRWLAGNGGLNAETLFRIPQALGFDVEIRWTPVLHVEKYEVLEREVAMPQVTTSPSQRKLGQNNISSVEVDAA